MLIAIEVCAGKNRWINFDYRSSVPQKYTNGMVLDYLQPSLIKAFVARPC
jgi:hypothetical protein